MAFFEQDWKTDAMTDRKYQINANMRFYKQEYCGWYASCAYAYTCEWHTCKSMKASSTTAVQFILAARRELLQAGTRPTTDPNSVL